MIYGLEQTLGPVSPMVTLGLGQRGERSLYTQPFGPSADEKPGRAGAATLKRENKETLRAGFGDGTDNGLGAAAKALDRGMESARRVVPRVEDILGRQRDRREARAEAAADRAAQNQFRHVERRRLEAVTQARTFINRLNEVTGTAQARLSGQEPPAAEQAATLVVNGETFDFGNSATAVRLDLRA